MPRPNRNPGRPKPVPAQPKPTPPLRSFTRRTAIKAIAAAAAAGSVIGRAATRAVAGPRFTRAQPGLIAAENRRKGTKEWMLTRTRIDPATKHRCPWIEGYASRTSVSAGERIRFHASTRPGSPFTMEIYRLGYYQGKGGRLMGSYGTFEGRAQPEPAIGAKRLRDCQWESFLELEIPATWVSGVYVGKLTEKREGIQSYIIFIVRDRRRADFIFQCSDTTWQAYNRWPSQFALYDNGEHQWWWGGDVAVSFNRPYGKYCQILDAPLSIGSGEFFLWEFPMVHWMESLGYDVTYTSNLDLHADPGQLERTRGFISAGHDEYYSIEMFNHLKDAVDRGLNIGFFSGNTICGRILFAEDTQGQPLRTYERTDVFSPKDPPEPFIAMATLPHASPNANTLIGARSIPPVTGGADWICTAPDHWIYQGTGMKEGDRIPGLIGWEWHGDPGPQPGLVIVASGETQTAPGKLNGGVYTATVYPGPKENFVFNASTCWWADALSAPPGYLRPSVYTTPKGPDPRAQKITQNILDRMIEHGGFLRKKA